MQLRQVGIVCGVGQEMLVLLVLLVMLVPLLVSFVVVQLVVLNQGASQACHILICLAEINDNCYLDSFFLNIFKMSIVCLTFWNGPLYFPTSSKNI